MSHDTFRCFLALVFTWLLSSCGSDETVSPSFVARTWTLELGGAQEMHDAVPGSTLMDFSTNEHVSVRWALGSKGENQACCDEWPLLLEGQTNFSLPPPPQTSAELQQEGLRVAAVTYCAFINEAGMPAEEDVEAVDRAVSNLLSVLKAPLREAMPTEGAVSRVTRHAGETLLKDVLHELGIAESDDAIVDAQSTRGLWFLGDLKIVRDRGSQTTSTGDLLTLIDLLPSLVWVHGDPRTRRTLSACGSMLWLDVPAQLLLNELGQLVLNCDSFQTGHAGICSAEYHANWGTIVHLRSPDVREVPFASWSIDSTAQ